MKLKKTASKRLTLHKKHSIRKKSQERRRKRIKEAKKHPNKRQKSFKTDGIPNLWPFKEQILQKQTQKKPKPDVAEIRKQAEIARNLFEENQQRIKQSTGHHDGSMSSFYREFKKIVEHSDVILEVLDARDPLGTRCKMIEKQILEKDAQKKIVLVLNKIDLIPKENLTQWLNYLRKEYPTVAFKSTKKVKHGNHAIDFENNMPVGLDGYTQCLGAKILMSLLKNYSRSEKVKRTITVGIIGIPNVGKSSLINSLKREQCVLVGSTPGLTRVAQEVSLDAHVKLFDGPGVIFTKSDSESESVLRNAVSITNIKDLFAPVQIIMSKCTREQLMEIYKIQNFHDMTEFLNIIARKYGKLKAGGVPDINAAARQIIQDWCKGNIPYYSIPPKDDGSQISAAIVGEWGKEFNIEEVESLEAKRVLQVLPEKNAFEFIKIQSSKPLDVNSIFKASTTQIKSTDKMIVTEDADENAGVSAKRLLKNLTDNCLKRPQQIDIAGTHDLANKKKREMRRRKLRQVKTLLRARMAASSAHTLSGAEIEPSAEEYDFKKDFWGKVPASQVQQGSCQEFDEYNM